MDMGIKGKTAIVCASSRGLGKGCALALAAEGVDLIINGRDQETLSSTAKEIREKYGVKVAEFCADITIKDQQINMMSDYLISRFKTLLENNREDDALSIMEEYILPNGEIEDDNYQWLFINDLTELKGAN